MAEGRKKEAAGVAKYYAAGKNVIDTESAAALQSSRGAIEAIGQGKQGEDVYQAGITSAREQARLVSGTKRIGGDVSAQVADFIPTLDALKRNEKLVEEAKKAGYGPDRLEEYVKKLQLRKTEKPDTSLEKNVDAARILQRSGLLIDQAAKAMDGASTAMVSAVKSFDEAVKMLAQASGTGVKQGAAVEKAKESDTAALNKQQAAMEQNKRVQSDPNASAKLKADAQKAEDDANKESIKTMAAKREAFLKEQNELREINKKQRIAGKEVFNTMEAARAAGAAPAAVPVAPVSAPATAPSVEGASPAAPAEKPVEVPQALTGGVFSGPDASSVMPTKTSMTANDILESIKQSTNKVEKKTVASELPNLEMASNVASKISTKTQKASPFEVLEKFTDLLEEKFEDVIDAISENNNIKEEILLYSRV